MAQKKISDLQLRSNADATCLFPVDDAVQTWRVTLAQVKAFILPASGVGTTELADASVTLAKLASAVADSLLPTATVMPYASAGTIPSGFLECDGTAVSRTTYAALFAKLAITHGQGDGSTTFNVPDYRGRFLRGYDGTAGNDPDKSSRSAMGTGGATGNNVGSVQGDAFTNHTHALTTNSRYNNGAPSVAHGASGDLVGGSQSTGTASTGGGNETRPKNAYVRYMIKV